ncbi:MAG: queuosine precursor transporter [Chitinophagales bacterium]|nr:queuosine precursor transporter [Bacteroidota bacterium]MCB9042768.1 queuosine precursor transporter [Chitinophagales bacterium]
MQKLLSDKRLVLFSLLGGFFIANALIAEFIGVKIFALEDTFGWESFNWNLFGNKGSLNFTAGVLLWPLIFVLTDIINEYFGKKGVQFLSFLGVGLIIYAFLMINIAIGLAPADWWVHIAEKQGVPNMQAAFGSIFGQSSWIIVGSLVAFMVGQIVDVFIFHRIKKITGEKSIWLRATGSTLVSQFIDSFVVLYIAFVLGPQHWNISLFLAIGTVNYVYKFVMAILLTPLIYLVHYGVEKYLGNDLATQMRNEALAQG